VTVITLIMHMYLIIAGYDVVIFSISPSVGLLVGHSIGPESVLWQNG